MAINQKRLEQARAAMQQRAEALRSKLTGGRQAPVLPPPQMGGAIPRPTTKPINLGPSGKQPPGQPPVLPPPPMQGPLPVGLGQMTPEQAARFGNQLASPGMPYTESPPPGLVAAPYTGPAAVAVNPPGFDAAMRVAQGQPFQQAQNNYTTSPLVQQYQALAQQIGPQGPTPEQRQQAQTLQEKIQQSPEFLAMQQQLASLPGASPAQPLQQGQVGLGQMSPEQAALMRNFESYSVPAPTAPAPTPAGIAALPTAPAPAAPAAATPAPASAGPFGGQAAPAPTAPTPAPNPVGARPNMQTPKPVNTLGGPGFKVGGMVTKMGPRVSAAAKADIAKTKQGNVQRGTGLATKGVGKFKVK